MVEMFPSWDEHEPCFFFLLIADASALGGENCSFFVSGLRALHVLVDGEDNHQPVLHFWNPSNCAIASASSHHG